MESLDDIFKDIDSWPVFEPVSEPFVTNFTDIADEEPHPAVESQLNQVRVLCISPPQSRTL